MKLLDDNELPAGFSYPGALRRLIDREITRLEPWWVFDGAVARERMKGLAQRYPGRRLVPFAKREDNDDVACFDLDEAGRVVVVHDFSSEGWERREHFDDFYAWLRRAVEDMIEFDRCEEG